MKVQIQVSLSVPWSDSISHLSYVFQSFNLRLLEADVDSVILSANPSYGRLTPLKDFIEYWDEATLGCKLKFLIHRGLFL